ncbi:MAG TPA: hypothetical protein PLM25_02080 [Limnochordia bacterium]|nr:hypothetical protein [Limnochordia bacterium]
MAKRGGVSGLALLSTNVSSPKDFEDNLFTPDIYREPFASEAQGELVGSFTPSSLIISLEGIQLEKPPGDTLMLSLTSEVNSTPDGGWSILPNFDLACANEILNAAYAVRETDFDWQSVRVTMFTRTAGWKADRPNSELPYVGQVKVDLGPDYANVDFGGLARLEGDLHVFEFADLIPLEGREDTVVLSMLFVDQVQAPFIINPDGAYVDNFRPTYWETDSTWGHAGYIIYNPGLRLDLRKTNHLIFEYDLTDLIEVYDNGTPEDPSDDLITFKLTNPFPIRFLAEQHTENPTPPEPQEIRDVDHLEIGYFDLLERVVVLKWTNPPLETFEQVRIVRKEGEAPQSLEDGEEVYTGRFPIFQDRDVEEGREYHYLVVVEDCYRTLSQGRRIGIKTDPPQVDEIRLRAREGGGYRWLEDTLTMTVGEKLWFSAIGWKNGTSVNIAPMWEIEQEDGVISLLYEQGDQNEIMALLPGRAVLTGYLPESFGSEPVSLTIIVEE